MMKHVHVGYAAPSIYISSDNSNTLTIKPTSVTLNLGDSLQLELSEESAVWESSDANVVTVDLAGKIIAVGSGKAVITAIFEDKKGICVVTVPNAELDTQYMYYGTIKTPNALIFNDPTITLSEINRAINENTLIKSELGIIESEIKNILGGDAIIVLLPNNTYKAFKWNLNDWTTFSEDVAGTNGVKIGDYYTYGEIFILPSGDITISVNVNL